MKVFYKFTSLCIIGSQILRLRHVEGVYMGSRSWVGEDEKGDTSEWNGYFWKMLPCLAWMEVFEYQFCAEVVKAEGISQVQAQSLWHTWKFNQGLWPCRFQGTGVKNMVPCPFLSPFRRVTAFWGHQSVRKEDGLSNFLCLLIKHTHMWKI